MGELDPTAITLASEGDEPFTLEPSIKTMLRTRRTVPGTIFIVEGVDVILVSEESGRQAVRLLLGDGKVCIQAMLNSELFGLVEGGEVYVGCYVRVDDFVLRFEEASEHEEDDEAPGGETMVCLIVNEMQIVGWNETYMALWRRLQKGKDVIRNERPAEEQPTEEGADANSLYLSDEDMVEIHVDKPAIPSKERVPPQPQPQPPVQQQEIKKQQQQQQPIAMPQDWHDHQVPLKLTTLRSIPHLPYAQNWSINVLAIIASLSPVEPSHLPPGKQRTARIADPSTAKQVHLTVFLDPESFAPRVGSAVLLTGVKNHRFDGGSLKKYASDGGKVGGRGWWFEDPEEMRWLDVRGIKAWWADMERYTSAGMSR